MHTVFILAPYLLIALCLIVLIWLIRLLRRLWGWDLAPLRDSASDVGLPVDCGVMASAQSPAAPPDTDAPAFFGGSGGSFDGGGASGDWSTSSADLGGGGSDGGIAGGNDGNTAGGSDSGIAGGISGN